MTYVLAIAKERDLTLSRVEDLKTSVIQVIDLILKDYNLDGESFMTKDKAQICEEVAEITGNLEDDCEVESLVDLLLLRKDISGKLNDLFSGKETGIVIFYESNPDWGIEINLENSNLTLEAYSNVDSSYLWDAVLKNIE